MAEISALTAARAFALQGDARIQREAQEEGRARVEALRQQQIDAQNRDAALQETADRQRLDRQRADLRAQGEARARFDAQALARETQILDQRRQLADAEFRDDETLALRQAGVDRKFELDRAFFAEVSAPQAGDSGRAARPDAVLAPTPADNAAPPEATPSPDQLREAAFQAVVAERDARVAERRAAERDAAIQQQIDQRLAADRIAETLFNPELPRGSVVDLTG